MLRIVQYLMRSATRPFEFKIRGATHQSNLKCVVKGGFEFKMGTTPAKKTLIINVRIVKNHNEYD